MSVKVKPKCEKCGKFCGKVHDKGVRKEEVVFQDDGSEILPKHRVSAPVGFTRPPTLSEMVKAAIVQERRAEADPDVQDFESEIEPEEFGGSPYELVLDPVLGRELTKGEKQFLDLERARFDQNYAQFKKQQREERLAASKKKEESKRQKTDKKDQETIA